MDELSRKFMGVGLINAIALSIFTLSLSVILKTIFTKYEIEGLSDFIRAS